MCPWQHPLGEDRRPSVYIVHIDRTHTRVTEGYSFTRVNTSKTVGMREASLLSDTSPTL